MIPASNNMKNGEWCVAIFKDFAIRSFDIQGRFNYGGNDEINSIMEEFPYMYVQPSDITVSPNFDGKSGYSSIEMTFQVTIADKLLSSKDNELQTFSDSQEIMFALISELSTHPYYVANQMKLVGDVPITTSLEADDAIVSKVTADITLRYPFKYTYCNQPVDNIPFYPTITTDIFGSVTQSICTLIEGCPVIINIQNDIIDLQDQIDNIIATGGTTGPQGLTGPQGESGSQGLTGPQGPSGVDGFLGGTGPQGFTGNQGETGPQGFQGPSGIDGFLGGTGPQGFTGNQGQIGPQGYTGPQGSPGFSTGLVYYFNPSNITDITGYFEMGRDIVIGLGTTKTATGAGDQLIEEFITIIGDPGVTNIPSGAWNFEQYVSMSSNGGTPLIYVDIFVRDLSGTETLIGSNTSAPHPIDLGVLAELYLFSVAIPTTTILLTDRIVVKFYARGLGGKTMTCYFEDNRISQATTSLSPALQGAQGLTGPQGETGSQGPTGPIPVIPLNEIAFGDGSGIISSPQFQVVAYYGASNIISTSNASSVFGGFTNEMIGSDRSSIIGGDNNYMNAAEGAIILGGSKNHICYTSQRSGILGGYGNKIINNSFDSGIVSGYNNCVDGSIKSSIIGGSLNCIQSQGSNSVIIGGQQNQIFDKTCYSSIIASYASVIGRSSCSAIIGGYGLTLSSEDGVVYVSTLKIATASNINADRVLVWDTDNYVKYRESSSLGGSTTGTASIQFLNTLSGYENTEVPEGRVLVNDANVLLTSTINIIVGTSSDHDSIEDAVYEDLNFKYEIEAPGQFTIYGYAPLDTFGIWNLIYRVIN